MSNLAMWSLIVGFFTPIVVAVIQQPKWSSGARAVITFLFCIITGGVTTALQGALTGERLVSSVLLILVTAITTYKGLWQPTGAAPALERATTPGGATGSRGASGP